MDMVVSRVRVLQENFIETAPAAPWEMLLGSGVPGPPSIRPRGVIAPEVTEEASVSAEGEAEGDFMDQIYDRKEASRDVEAEGEGVGAAAGAGAGGDTLNNAQIVNDTAGSDAEALPVLTLGTINLFGHDPSLASTSLPSKGKAGGIPVSVSPPMQVTVVDSYSKIQHFAAAVRKLSLSASSSSGRPPRGTFLNLLLTIFCTD